jgi:hypothetical protein
MCEGGYELVATLTNMPENIEGYRVELYNPITGTTTIIC